MAFFGYFKKNKTQKNRQIGPNGFIVSDNLKIRKYENQREKYQEKLADLDNKIVAIQNSTKTTIPQLAPLHHRLRQKYKWYYHWHLNPNASKTHWGVLLIYLVAVFMGVFYGAFSPPYQKTYAATTTCTWTNGGGDHLWSTAANWNCGADPAPPDANNDVIFDGATTSANATIDAISTVGSFRMNANYNGTIFANANLSTTTSADGTGDFYIGHGTFKANATTITVTGSWYNAGNSFTANSSTVSFTGGTAETISGNMADPYIYDGFYNLTFNNAAGSWTLLNNMEVSSVLTVNAGTFNASANIDLSGGGTPFVINGTFNPGTGQVKYSSPADTTIASGSYHNLWLADPSQTAIIRPDEDGHKTEWTSSAATHYQGLLPGEGALTAPAGATVDDWIGFENIPGLTSGATISDIKFYATTYNIDSGIMTADVFLHSIDDDLDASAYPGCSAKTLNFSEFGPIVETLEWSGLSLTKSQIDKVAISVKANGNAFDAFMTNAYLEVTYDSPAAPVYTLASGSFNVSGQLLIGSGFNDTMTVNANTNDPTISADNVIIWPDATFIASDSSALTVGDFGVNSGGTFTHSNGQVNFSGSSNHAFSASVRLYNVNHTGSGKLTLGTNLILDGSLSISAGTVDVSTRSLTVGGNISISHGTLDASDGNIDLNGDLSLSGTLNAPGSGKSFTVSGDWANTGTFNPGTGTVGFDGASGSTQTISGNTVFNNLTVQSASARSIKFTGDSITTVNGTWTIAGTSGNLITLNSTNSNQWRISAATANVSYADISNSKNTGNYLCATHSQSTSNNNSGWEISSTEACGVPFLPADLAQKKVDGTTISHGGGINQSSIKFTATVSDPNNPENLNFCVENKPTDDAFTGSDETCSGNVAFSGTSTEAEVVVTDLQNSTDYHWQARTKDDDGNSSAWVPYGTSDDTDYRTNFYSQISKISILANGTQSIAGSPFEFRTLIYDSNNNLITDSTDIIAFSSNDSNAVFEHENHTFSLNDNGSYTQKVTFKTAGTQKIIATSPNKVEGSLSVNVSPGSVSANYSTLSALKTKIEPDAETEVTVKLTDDYGNGVPGKSINLFSNRSDDTISPVGAVTESDGSAVFNFEAKSEGQSVLGAHDTSDNIALTQTLTIDVKKSSIAQNVIDTLINTFTDPVNVIKNIATPLVSTTAALGFLPLLAQAFPQTFHAFASIFPALFTAAGLKRRRKPWGRVFDAISGHSVDLAIVRLFDAKTKRLLATKVTDENGQFNFLLSKGGYYIRVTKPGYKFPPKISKLKASQLATRLGPDADIYQGQIFAIAKNGTNINLNIPLDPILSRLPFGLRTEMQLKNAFDWLLIVLSYISIPMLLSGAVISIFSLLIVRTQFNFYLNAVYFFLLIAFLVSKKIKQTRLGMVFDSENGLPIANAVVSIYDKEYNAIREVKITDSLGQFAILAPKGEFYLGVNALGYKYPSKKRIPSRFAKKFNNPYYGNVIFNHRSDFINLDIPLDKS